MTDTPEETRARGPWWAFWSGLRLAVRHWPLLLLFYLVLVLLAAMVLLPLQQALVRYLGYRLAAWEVAEGIPGWLVGQIVRDAPAQSAAIAGTAQGIALFLPASLLVFSLPFAVLGAGALAAYAADSQRRFWPAVARYVGPFALLQVLEVVLLEITVALGLFVGGLALAGLVLLSTRSASGTSAILLVLVGIILTLLVLVLVALGLLIPWWFEYARALAVVQGERHVLRVLGKSAAFLRRNLGPAAGLALFNFLLVFVPYLPYGMLAALMPAAWWPAHIVVQQLLIVAIIGTRLARLAAQVRLVQARGQVTTPAIAAGRVWEREGQPGRPARGNDA